MAKMLILDLRHFNKKATKVEFSLVFLADGFEPKYNLMLFDQWEKSYIRTFSLFTFTYYLIDKFRKRRVKSEELRVKK